MAEANLDAVRERASSALGEDPYGLRAEFVDLVNAYRRGGVISTLLGLLHTV